jgi:uncharacterized protein (TIGR03435 family)
VDRTGLRDRFELDLSWDYLLRDLPADTLRSNAAIFDALQQQLGLKLESARAPYPFLVIDAAQRRAAQLTTPERSHSVE